MNFEFFIAKRLFSHKDEKKQISGTLVNVSVFGIALCIAVMIISLSVLLGFKNEIRNKITGFGSHVQIVNFDSNESYETKPISKNQEFLRELKQAPGVHNVQVFATKAGIIKTDKVIQGIVLKGIGSDFDWSFFERNLVEGSVFEVNDTAKTNEVLISKRLANMLKLKLNDGFISYFVQDPPRVRKFKIKGIYETGVEEIDKMVVLADIGHIQRLNDWTTDQISGFEINIGSFDQIDPMAMEISDIVGYSFNQDGEALRVISIKQKYPQIFDWLNLQDMNVLIILVLLLSVSAFNMIAGLLILILDRTQMIGLFKAMGSSNKMIRKIFIIESWFLILKGLFWGNLVGIGLCLLQQYTGVLKLDPVSYYINQVPISIHVGYILLLNISVMLLTLLMLVFPSYIISKFSPHETIRYS